MRFVDIMGSFDEITKDRRSHWLSAMLRYRTKNGHCANRDASCWIFGAWHGDRYDDNSKYLFEYVNYFYSDVKAVWLSNNDDVVQHVRSLGFEAELSDSEIGISLQKRAGFVFFTNGIDDISLRPCFFGAELICLWHGVSQKLSYRSANKRTGIVRLAKNIKDDLFSWVFRDYSLATSYQQSRDFQAAFHITEANIGISGQPRNDCLVGRSSKAAEFDNYILYMPTFGSNRNEAVKEALSILGNREIQDVCSSLNMRVIVKLHPLMNLAPEAIPESIQLANEAETASTQELLKNASVLITDYSSCITDFALLQRPIILFALDYEEYQKDWGLLPNWDKVYKEHLATDQLSLLSRLSDLAKGESGGVVDWLNWNYSCREGFGPDPEYPFSSKVIKLLAERYPDLRKYLQEG